MAHAHSHSHAPSSDQLVGNDAARRALVVALVLGTIILVIEVIAGFAFGSLALLGDAAHALTDVGAYAIALGAASIARRPVSTSRTFGHGRIEIVAALLNGATLLAACGWITFEAMRRLAEPHEVAGVGVAIVAAISLVANGLVVLMLYRSASASLNIRGAMLHAVGDMLGSVAVLASGVIIAVTGWERADSVVSLLLVAIIIVGAWRLVRASVDELLVVAPAGMGADTVGALLLSVDGVLEVHDVHVWTIAPGLPAASAHVRITGRAAEEVLDDLQLALKTSLGISHSTLQLRRDRGSIPLDAVPLMSLEDAIDWTTNHVARTHPDLSRAVISAAAGAAAIGIGQGGRISPVLLSTRTLGSLGQHPRPDRDDPRG